MLSKVDQNRLAAKQQSCRLKSTRFCLFAVLLLTIALFSINVASFMHQEAGVTDWGPPQLLQHNGPAFSGELSFLTLSSAALLCVLATTVHLLIRVSKDLKIDEIRASFIDGVSHELKRPLSLIRLYSKTLVDDDAITGEERRNYIHIIARESRRLNYLIPNALVSAKIEPGRSRKELKLGNLAPVVQQTVSEYSEFLAQNGFLVNTEIPPCLPHIRFDRSEMAQVVMNLLDNATNSEECRGITVRMRSTEDDLVLEVEDHGIGIPLKEQKTIFEPLNQVPNKNQKLGSGLGLYIVRHVVDGMGGKIALHRVPGRGSRFTLSFPISNQPVREIAYDRPYVESDREFDPLDRSLW